MHHAPAGPPLSARVVDALHRWALLTRSAAGYRGGRLALGAMVSTVVTALVIAVPVVAGSGDSATVLGRDGQPVYSRTFAGLTSAATLSSATGEASPAPVSAGSSAAGTPTSAPSPTSAAPVAPTTDPAPTPAPPDETTPAVDPVTSAPEVPASPSAPVVAAAVPAAVGLEDQVVALVNAERATAGCHPVVADADLAAGARAHSEDMRDRGYFDHVNRDGDDPFDRAEQADVTARAENIARGQADATAVMKSWLESKEHRANIVDCSLTRLGVGIADGGGGPWWTQLFG